VDNDRLSRFVADELAPFVSALTGEDVKASFVKVRPLASRLCHAHTALPK
jgi:hypothetical protein